MGGKQEENRASSVWKVCFHLLSMIVATSLFIGSFLYIMKLDNIYQWVNDAKKFEQESLVRKDGVWYNSGCFTLKNFEWNEMGKALDLIDQHDEYCISPD